MRCVTVIFLFLFKNFILLSNENIVNTFLANNSKILKGRVIHERQSSCSPYV